MSLPLLDELVSALGHVRSINCKVEAADERSAGGTRIRGRSEIGPRAVPVLLDLLSLTA